MSALPKLPWNRFANVRFWRYLPVRVAPTVDCKRPWAAFRNERPTESSFVLA